jgi:hypothetical protein
MNLPTILAQAPPIEDEARRLLRESPLRMAVNDDKYWAWRRRVEAFLATIPTQAAGDASA